MNVYKKILRHFTLFFLCLIASNGVFAGCSLASNAKKNKEIMDTICDPTLGDIDLKYSIKKRKIWLTSIKAKNKPTVLELGVNKGPEILDLLNNIKFISRTPIAREKVNLIALTVLERTRANDGAGQCGSGAEVYFVVYSIINSRFVEVTRVRISSCAAIIGMDKEDLHLIRVIGNEVHFKNYYNQEKDILGTATYNFDTNTFLQPEIEDSPKK